MNPELTALLAACIVFVGAHFVMSHPLRAPLVRGLGERAFLGVYSLVILAAFAWLVVAFRAAPPGAEPLWNGRGTIIWALASALTLISLVLLLGSLRGNPALPGRAGAVAARAEARGVYAITRHPMMWSFGLWAIAHIIVMPVPRTLILAGSILFLALFGAHLQDRKKEALLGDSWRNWERKTSYWPRWLKLPQAGAVLWLTGIVLWFVLTLAHVWIGYIPAGIWRWIW